MNVRINHVRSVKKLAESSEKPAGEWNTMEVTCTANTITVYVNGVLQNKATGLNVTSGHICLQSEGKDLEFRNVTLTRLKNRIVDIRVMNNLKRKKVAFHTLGCKLNFTETSTISRSFP